MKKTVQLVGILISLIMLGCLFLHMDNRTVWLKTDENEVPIISLKVNEEERTLEPWFNKRDGLYYFFLPSFVSDNKVYCDLPEEEIVLSKKNALSEAGTDGEAERVLSKWSQFRWEDEQVYNMKCSGQVYEVVFMKSANIPALFVETESGTMEYLNEDKKLIETGSISVVKATKNVEYQGKLKKISARGNSTFDYKDKKAYSFTLNDAYPLCGMDAGKKWNLLAMYFEYDKIHTKLVSDMTEVLGMEYNTDCTWVDLYCNGEYQGLYLLTEAITVGEGRVDIYDLEKSTEENANISGGYLLEKDVESHLEEDGNGFITKQCNYPFIIKKPESATEKQMEYISSYVQKIEDLLVAGDTAYKKYIDLDSFAKQFLIDKLVLEPDAMNMSTFYYKEADSDVLKAGPLWDYDRAFGAALPNYTLSIGDYPNPMSDWYMQLYEDEEYKGKLLGYYKELLPFLQEAVESGIDEYADYIRESVKMDAVMWPNEYYQTDMMSYLEYDSHIKYLKYFLANRINYLNEAWEIVDWYFEVPPSNGEQHEVSVVMDDGTVVDTQRVKDGSSMDSFPELNGEKYSGWEINDGGKIYSSHIPIYEDVVLNAKRKFENIDERMSYKIEKLNAAADVLSYMKVLEDKDFSVCIFLSGSSELTWEEAVLNGLKRVCDFKHPDWLDQPLEEGRDYFLVSDNGWRKVWDGAGEPVTELNTTFGLVRYITDSEGDVHLYIQEEETDYLHNAGEKAITFVVINRYTGEVADVASFDTP